MRSDLSVLSVAMAVMLLHSCRAQVDDEKQDQIEALQKILVDSLKKENIDLDLEKKTLTIPVVVNRPSSDLEYLLVYTRGKKHEALLVTLSKPSVIQTGFLALGLDLDVGLADCLVLIPPVLLITTLPISIAGWGVRELSMVAAFALIGVSDEGAVALSVLFGLVIAVMSLPGGLIWLLGEDRAANIEAAPRE